jgi:hypothetical protein
MRLASSSLGSQEGTGLGGTRGLLGAGLGSDWGEIVDEAGGWRMRIRTEG